MPDDSCVRLAACGGLPVFVLVTLLGSRLLWALGGEGELVSAPPGDTTAPPMQARERQSSAAASAVTRTRVLPVRGETGAPRSVTLDVGSASVGGGVDGREQSCVLSDGWEGCWGPPPRPRDADTSRGEKVNVRAFTSLTGPHLHYCATLGSAAMSGLPLDIVGWQGEKGRGAWRGKAFNLTWRKVLQAEEYSRALPDPSAVVLYTDGGDTVVTAQSASALAAVFLEWESRTGLSFLLSAEVNCYMRTLPKDGCKHAAYPWRKETYAYPNTGVWVARAWAASWFFRGVRRFAEARHPDTSKRLDDQAIMGEVLAVVPATRRVVGLDHRNAVFQNLFLAWEPWHFCRTAAGRLRNTKTGGYPLVWHANGPKLFYSPQKGLAILSDIINKGAPWARDTSPPHFPPDQAACEEGWGRYVRPHRFPSRKFKPIQRCRDP
eukprot:Hpha_TRINITY_DN18790_c0_g1::TRINITY_DN18790_c0_g1_i1::g.47423::m.47423